MRKSKGSQWPRLRHGAAGRAVRRSSDWVSRMSETGCATRCRTIHESVADTVRLCHTKTLVELNILISDFSEPKNEPSRLARSRAKDGQLDGRPWPRSRGSGP